MVQASAFVYGKVLHEWFPSFSNYRAMSAKKLSRGGGPESGAKIMGPYPVMGEF